MCHLVMHRTWPKSCDWLLLKSRFIQYSSNFTCDQRYLKAGGLHGDTFLQTNSDIFNMIKEANVTLRWILLHSFATSRKVKQVTDYSEGVVKLLLNLSALEYEVRRIYLELLTSRNSKRDRACQIIKDNLK